MDRSFIDLWKWFYNREDIKLKAGNRRKEVIKYLDERNGNNSLQI